MKLSTRTRYALRAAAELALRGAWRRNGREAPVVSLTQLSRRQGIAVQYLRQIFGTLRKKGIVTSVQGRSGGYVLARPPESISALDVLRAMGEGIDPVACVSRPSSCKRVKECPTYPLWCRLADEYKEVLGATTVAQLADRCPRRGTEPLPRGYAFDI